VDCAFWITFRSSLFYVKEDGGFLMMKMLRNKRGEMSTQQIITLIILITSFVVILFFLVRLNLKDTTDDELCHNSVITRASGSLGKNTPLKCHREYVCISSTNSCDKMTSAKVEKVSSKEDVYGILAEEMADCWWMFGEGKLDYVGKELSKQNYCSICDQISFDSSLYNDPSKSIFPSGKLDKEELYNYLANNNVAESDKTYFEYFYGTNDFLGFKQELYSGGANFGSLDLNEHYYIMMGITSRISIGAWIAIGVGTIITPFTLITGSIVGGIYLAVNTGNNDGGMLSPIVEGESGNQFLSPSIIKINSQEFKDLDCSSIETLA
jgi:hypothetical protein